MGGHKAGLMAWLGPAIGACCFEVCDEVRAAFLSAAERAGASPMATADAFVTVPGNSGKSLMDIYAVARLRLMAIGVDAVYGGGQCTVCDSTHFYSYRRDGVTGRMASIVYLKT